ncbi:MAG: PTS sugar transporter subunit IIA [bacterium]|nr:PTS sugar transporter subunit IIA [bacterium]
MNLSAIMVDDAIIPAMTATTRDDAIVELIGALVDVGAIADSNAQGFTDAIIARETQASTGIGNGVAFPHARVKGVKNPIVAIGCSHEGIEFNSIDAKPVDLIVLLLSNPDEPGEHLEAMEAVFKHVQRRMFRTEMQACKMGDEIIELVKNGDQGV